MLPKFRLGSIHLLSKLRILVHEIRAKQGYVQHTLNIVWCTSYSTFVPNVYIRKKTLYNVHVRQAFGLNQGAFA